MGPAGPKHCGKCKFVQFASGNCPFSPNTERCWVTTELPRTGRDPALTPAPMTSDKLCRVQKTLTNTSFFPADFVTPCRSQASLPSQAQDPGAVQLRRVLQVQPRPSSTPWSPPNPSLPLSPVSSCEEAAGRGTRHGISLIISFLVALISLLNPNRALRSY